MKRKELHSLKPEELNSRLAQLQDELMRERGNIAHGKLSQKTSHMKKLKKTVARIHTKLHEIQSNRGDVSQ